MKNLYRMFLTVALMLGVVSTNAQNSCVMKSGKNSERVVTFSEKTTVVQQSENHVSTVSLLSEPHNNFRGINETHHLIVNLPEDFDMMIIGDASGNYFDLAHPGDGTFEADLEEGTYCLFLNGSRVEGEDYYHCNWTRDFILDGDMEITIDLADCIYSLNLQAVNESGVSFEEGEYDIVDYEIVLSYHKLVTATESMMWDTFLSEVPEARYNGFSEECPLAITVQLSPVGEIKDYLLHWYFYGMNDDVTLTCTTDDLSSHEEIYSVNPPEGQDAIFNFDYKTYFSGGSCAYTGFNMDHLYKPELPYTVISNSKVTDFSEPNFVVLMPNVFEWIDLENQDWPPYYNSLRAGFYFDNEGNAVKEPKPIFLDGLEANENPLPNSPMKSVLGPEQAGYNGVRTPLGYFVPRAFSSEQLGGGQPARLSGGIFYGGETGCERVGDSDALISVTTNDGTTLFYDSLYRYYDAYFEFENPEQVYIQVQNNHLVYNGVVKSNVMDVMIDYSQDDVMPPTMTFLRVNDANGEESVELPDMEHSTLVFGCADFGWHYREDWASYDYIVYGGKPMVELLYSVGESAELNPLEFTEDENLFNDNYGNVFVVDLAQLADVVNNEWVSLTFALSDEAGNSQTQELSNVFFAGQQTTVNEQTSTVAHSVYPNPFSGEVRINAAEAVNGNANISVFNVLGEQVISKAMQCNGTTEFVIDGSSLNAGIYFYSIATENGTLQGRIVKE